MATVAKSPRSSKITLASASAGPFDLDFRLFDDDGLNVYVNGLSRTDWTLSSNYTDGYDDNATVTFNAPLSIDDVIVVDGFLAPRRDIDYVDGPGLTDKLNIELARIWSSLSELRRDTERSVKVFGYSIPTNISTGHAIIKTATGFGDGPDSDEISNAQANAVSAAASAAQATSAASQAALYDWPHFDALTDLQADTTLTYATGQATTVSVGDTVRLGDGRIYEVVGPVSAGEVQTSNATPVQLDIIYGSTVTAAATVRAARSIVVGDTYVNAANEAGLDKTGATDMSAKLQELLGDGEVAGDGVNVAPVGSKVVIDPGLYKLLSGVTMKRNVDLILASDATLRGDMPAVTDDILTVDILDALNGQSDYPRALTISGGRLFHNTAFEGRHALHITGTLFNATIKDMLLTGYSDATRDEHGLYMTGYSAGVSNGPTFCTIESNQISNGAFLDNVADGNRIHRNNVFGNLGVKLDIVNGAYNTSVRDNAIVNRDGALHVVNGSMIQFIGNQVEQNGVNASNFGGKSYQLLLEGAARRIKGFRCEGNNFGGGSNVNIPIIVDTAEDALFDRNHHNPGSDNFDFKFTSNARFNEVRSAVLRGARSAAPYDARADLKLRVQEIGTGNSGFWRSIATWGALQNSWSHANCYLDRDHDGMVKFQGHLVVGTTTDAILVTTLPDGLWPFQTEKFAVPVTTNTGAIRGMGILQVNAAGALRAYLPAGSVAGDQVHMSGAVYQTMSRSVYDGADG